MEYQELNDCIWSLYNAFYSELYGEEGTDSMSVYVKYSCLMSHAIGLAYSQRQITADQYGDAIKSYGYISQAMLETARLRKKGY